MSLLHYCTFGGADNRSYYIRRSYECCRDYFDQFHILDTGAVDDLQELTADKLQDGRVRYRKLQGDALIQSDWVNLLEQLIADVPMGDWFLHMDSDERPSPYALLQLRELTVRGEKDGIDQFLLPGLPHLDGHPHDRDDLEAINLTNWLLKLPRSAAEFVPGCIWTKSCLIRKLPGLAICCNGSHHSFAHTDPSSKREYAPLWYNHYRTRSQRALSMLLHVWPVSTRLPTYGVDDPEVIRRHEEILCRSGLRDPTQLVQAGLAEALPDYVCDYIASWADSPYLSLRQASSCLTEWRFQVTLDDRCPEICCRYGV